MKNRTLTLATCVGGFLLAVIGIAIPQSGLLPSGYVMGNGTSSARAITGTPLSSVLDQSVGNTSGQFAVRGASTWGSRVIAGADLPTPTPSARGGILSTQIRELLTGGRSYFIRTDGSDANDGLTNSAGGAFLTVQKGIDSCAALDLNLFACSIAVADGTYTGIWALKSYTGVGPISIIGNTTTPANALISTTTGSVSATNVRGTYTINGFKFTASTPGHTLVASVASSPLTLNNIDFGSTNAGNHVLASFQSVIFLTSYTISGGSAQHFNLSSGAVVQAAGVTVTLTGTPAFTGFYMFVNQAAVAIYNANTFAGTGATGTRYFINNGGVLDIGGVCAGTPGYLPGSVNGSVANGGICS